MMLAPGVRDAIVARMAQQILVPPEPLLRRITAPTLLMWGDQDAMIPPSNAADYLRDLPNAKLVSLPHVGHLPQEEAPAATLPILQTFLSE
jgi:pimeloyl-ACP methyl ester carboxylesterase